MKTKTRIFSQAIGVVLALGLGSAEGATIYLSPVSGPVATGGQETFNLIANFGTQETIGGAIDFTWDPSVLTFQNFTFGSALAPPIRDTGFDVIDNQSSSLESIGFGNFGGISLPTDTVVGTLTFNAVGAPGSSTAINMANSVKWAGFYDTNGNPIDVTYTGLTAKISAVPLPASGLLMLSGLVGLIGVARRVRRG